MGLRFGMDRRADRRAITADLRSHNRSRTGILCACQALARADEHKVETAARSGLRTRVGPYARVQLKQQFESCECIRRVNDPAVGDGYRVDT
jgi:hypothetical protein